MISELRFETLFRTWTYILPYIFRTVFFDTYHIEQERPMLEHEILCDRVLIQYLVSKPITSSDILYIRTTVMSTFEESIKIENF